MAANRRALTLAFAAAFLLLGLPLLLGPMLACLVAALLQTSATASSERGSGRDFGAIMVGTSGRQRL